MLQREQLIQAWDAMAPRDTADGSPADMPVYAARPQDGDGAPLRPGMVVFQEIFGVNTHIKDVTRRFAALGYVAVSPDIFYRAGHWKTFDYGNGAAVRPMLSQWSEAQLMGDAHAALDFLRAQPGVDPNRVGVVGYCFGGRMSYLTAATFPDRVAACSVYYGGGLVGPPDADGKPTGPVARAGNIRCPVLGLFGETDHGIPREHVEVLDQALASAGVQHETLFYPGAGHGFFCEERASFHPQAAQDAWLRTAGFFAHHLGPVPPVRWA